MEFLSGLTQALEGNFAESSKGRHPWVEQWLHLAKTRYEAGEPFSEATQVWDFQDALEACAATLLALIGATQDTVEAELLRRARDSVLALVDCLDEILETDSLPDFSTLGLELDALLAEVLESQRGLEQFSEARLDEQAGQGGSFRVSAEILQLHQCLQNEPSSPQAMAQIEGLRTRYREARRLLAEQGGLFDAEIERLLLALEDRKSVV